LALYRRYNGDGKKDLAVTNFTQIRFPFLKIQVRVKKFHSGRKIDYATGDAPYGVAINDLDGDGKPDFAVTNEYSTQFLYLETQAKKELFHFLKKKDYPVTYNCTGIAIGDLTEMENLTLPLLMVLAVLPFQF
jgi:hypothetical protein